MKKSSIIVLVVVSVWVAILLAAGITCFVIFGNKAKSNDNNDINAEITIEDDDDDDTTTSNKTTSNKEDSKDILNDNDSYYFIYEGKKFTAGDKLSDIEDKTSLTFNTKEKDEEVPANRYMIGAGHLENSNKKSVLSVVPYNPGSSAAKIPDTLIGGFSLDSYDLKYESSLADVEIVGGIKLDSTIEEVKKVFGEPESTYEGSSYDKYTYSSDEIQRYFEIKFSKDEGKVVGISWKNLVFNETK